MPSACTWKSLRCQILERVNCSARLLAAELRFTCYLDGCRLPEATGRLPINNFTTPCLAFSLPDLVGTRALAWLSGWVIQESGGNEY